MPIVLKIKEKKIRFYVFVYTTAVTKKMRLMKVTTIPRKKGTIIHGIIHGIS